MRVADAVAHAIVVAGGLAVTGPRRGGNAECDGGEGRDENQGTHKDVLLVRVAPRF